MGQLRFGVGGFLVGRIFDSDRVTLEAASLLIFGSFRFTAVNRIRAGVQPRSSYNFT